MDKISNAPDHLVRAVLIALCEDSRVRGKAEDYLDKLTTHQPTGTSGGGKGAAAGAPPPTKKRKAESAIQVCVQCKEPFYPEENVGKPCRYHHGELEVDYDDDFWADHDEQCHGTIDTAEMREEYPEGFYWDCCDKPGDAKGCSRGRHRDARDSQLKADSPASRVSAGDSEDDEDEDEDEDDE